MAKGDPTRAAFFPSTLQSLFGIGAVRRWAEYRQVLGSHVEDQGEPSPKAYREAELQRVRNV